MIAPHNSDFTPTFLYHILVTAVKAHETGKWRKVLCKSSAAATDYRLESLLGRLTPCFAANWRALVPFLVLLFTEMPACHQSNPVWQMHETALQQDPIGQLCGTVQDCHARLHTTVP